MKYLITDDSKMGRKMITKVLNKYLKDGDEVLQATNGAEAVEIYKQHRPDLCFMDLTMPVMDGYEATLQITQFDEEAKIFVVSADVQAGAVEKAVNNGALDFIKKPIDEEKMKDIITELGYA